MNVRDEYELLRRIESTDSADERESLISELDCLPLKLVCFTHRWLRVHDVDALDGWSDDGYDPSQSIWPRDIQLLAATDDGVADIRNGGFSQLFWNETGVFAPEMLEWFERAGLEECAEILAAAMAVLGPKFPRDRELRQDIVESHWDSFKALDDRFFLRLPYEEREFERSADRWLKGVCGIRSLRDTPWSSAE